MIEGHPFRISGQKMWEPMAFIKHQSLNLQDYVCILGGERFSSREWHLGGTFRDSRC
jgi:hypothetical protein